MKCISANIFPFMAVVVVLLKPFFFFLSLGMQYHHRVFNGLHIVFATVVWSLHCPPYSSMGSFQFGMVPFLKTVARGSGALHTFSQNHRRAEVRRALWRPFSSMPLLSAESERVGCSWMCSVGFLMHLRI